MTRRGLRHVIAAAVTARLTSAVVSACPICFQFDDANTAAGVSTAVFVLAGVTVAVLIPCGCFAWRLARRDTPEHTTTKAIE
jgi:hypothetical protein